jgi:hypothetical protein
MDNDSMRALTDAGLLAETRRAAASEREAIAELVALLAEVDTRRLYLGQGYPSMFNYCTRALLLSEHAAYARIAAARTSRRFPGVLALLRDGAVTLTNLVLLSPHLTPENCSEVLVAAKHRSKAEVERLIVVLAPQPDIAASIRRLPHPSPVVADDLETQPPPMPMPMPRPLPVPTEAASSVPTQSSNPLLSGSTRPAVVAPLSADRFLLRVTFSADTRAKLQRAQDLMRHSCPTGDPAVVIDRALSVLVAHLEKARQGLTPRPRTAGAASRRRRYVPAAVKRAVWTRDDARCAFVGRDGRCAATGFLELHHVVPYAAGGRTDADNLQLRCRAHNAYEAERDFGARTDSAASNPSSRGKASPTTHRLSLYRRRA